jgi:hypothetical protein
LPISLFSTEDYDNQIHFDMDFRVRDVDLGGVLRLLGEPVAQAEFSTQVTLTL